MAVLYRKYRPQTFSEVLGQEYIIQTLKNQVASNNLSHAYLFTGSRGIGKTSIARILAKAVNCQNMQGGDACGNCSVCKQIEQGNFIDLIEVDAASNTGVDNIRDLIEHVKFSPSLGKYKIFIIDEVHMLSKGAFNALLKTLEEPPAHAIFILATTESGKVPLTIISRSQKFDFRRLVIREIKRQIEKILKSEGLSLNEKIIELLAQNSEGSVRDALSLLDKVTTLGENASLEECELLLGVTDISQSEKLLDLISLGKEQELPSFFEGLLEKGSDLVALNRDFLEYLRKALIFKITNDKKAVALEEEHVQNLENLIAKISASDIVYFIKLFLKSFKDLSSAPKAEIPLLIASFEAALKKNALCGSSVLPKEVLAEKREDRKIETADQQSEPLTNKPEEASVEEIQVKWGEFVNKVKNVNSPLANTIKSSPLLGVEGGVIKLQVKFLFHKQNLQNTKNQELTRGILKEIFGKNLQIGAEVVKEESLSKDLPNQGLDEALKLFGGEVIN